MMKKLLFVSDIATQRISKNKNEVRLISGIITILEQCIVQKTQITKLNTIYTKFGIRVPNSSSTIILESDGTNHDSMIWISVGYEEVKFFTYKENNKYFKSYILLLERLKIILLEQTKMDDKRKLFKANKKLDMDLILAMKHEK